MTDKETNGVRRWTKWMRAFTATFAAVTIILSISVMMLAAFGPFATREALDAAVTAETRARVTADSIAADERQAARQERQFQRRAIRWTACVATPGWTVKQCEKATGLTLDEILAPDDGK